METPTPDDIATDVQERSNTALKRGLASRHMQMIAIGGAIGTGLFLASGRTVSNAGPGGALVAYAAIGLMVLLLMQSLGEMSAHQPVAGSFQTFATKFVSPSFGFAMGWNYWFNWAVTVAADLVASGLVMAYWFPSVPSWLWAVGFLIIVVGLNALSARVYGEAEFWLAAIKVVIVIIFVLSGVFMIAGVMGDNSPGLSNWTTGDAPFHNGFVGVIAVFMIAGFSFQGTELVGVAAGESENPRRDVPRSIRTVFWRIMFFYIGAIAVIGTLLPYTDPSLLSAADDSANNVAQSPFTLVFARMGIGAAAAVMNAVILTSILSAGNSGLYAASRMLHSMAPRTCRIDRRSSRPVPSSLSSCAWSSWPARTMKQYFTARCGRLPPPISACRSSVLSGGATTWRARTASFPWKRWTWPPSRSSRSLDNGDEAGARRVVHSSAPLVTPERCPAWRCVSCAPLHRMGA